MNRREFLKTAGKGAVAAAAATTVNAPFVHAKKKPIKWRVQSYAGPTLVKHVCKPQINMFNKVAQGEMVIEL